MWDVIAPALDSSQIVSPRLSFITIIVADEGPTMYHADVNPAHDVLGTS
jgi:hypothetical protein